MRLKALKPSSVETKHKSFVVKENEKNVKIYINRTPIRGPWGGGAHFINAFHRIVPDMGHEIVPPESMTVAPDVILIAGLDNDGCCISAEQAIMYKVMMESRGRDVKVVIRVNENDARKGTTNVDDYLLKLAEHMDGTVFVSNWLRDYFMERGWPGDNNHIVIVNGVDRKIFKPQPKLDNGKLNIVTHHWSDNYMKGFDVYEQLDEFVGQNPDKFAFTYIGRHRHTFKHAVTVGPLHGKQLGEELGKHDVYVSASRFDPGPNHVAESISCELPTYVHANGGGCVEFAGNDHVYRDWEELKKILVNGQFEPNSTKFSSWSDCIDQYVKFIKELAKQ